MTWPVFWNLCWLVLKRKQTPISVAFILNHLDISSSLTMIRLHSIKNHVNISASSSSKRLVNQTYLKQQVRGFAKKITFGTDARAAMLSGVEQLADAVRFGLGGIGFYVW